MAVTTVTATDVAKALETALAGVGGGLRVYRYVADTVRPPAVVINMPTKDYTDTDSGFCRASWFYPLSLVVSRNQDRAAQEALAQFEADVAGALDAADAEALGLWAIEPQTSRPNPVTVSGQDLPGYLLNVRVRA